MSEIRSIIHDSFPKTLQRRSLIRFFYLLTSRSSDIRNRLHKKKVADLDYIVLPARLAYMALGRSYKSILSRLEELDLLECVDLGKNQYGYNTIAYKPLKRKIRCIASDKPLKEQAIEIYENYLETYHKDDRVGNIMRDNIKRTTYKGEPVRPIVHKDNFSGRYHHYLTNIPHRQRLNHTLIDGEKLVELDVVQCQIKIFERVLRELSLGHDFTTWISGGNDLYDHIKDVYKIKTRKQSKQLVYKMLFGTHNNKASIMMYNLFPDLQEPLRLIKTEKDPDNPSRKIYSNLARMLQKLEVRLLKLLASDLEHNLIPFISVHDSVMVKESDLECAKELFEEILDEYLYDAEIKTTFPVK